MCMLISVTCSASQVSVFGEPGEGARGLARMPKSGGLNAAKVLLLLVLVLLLLVMARAGAREEPLVLVPGPPVDGHGHGPGAT